MRVLLIGAAVLALASVRVPTAGDVSSGRTEVGAATCTYALARPAEAHAVRVPFAPHGTRLPIRALFTSLEARRTVPSAAREHHPPRPSWRRLARMYIDGPNDH